jgi:hypothetical protein
LQFGQLGQAGGELANQSSGAITDAIYKQAMADVYRQGNLLEQERNQLMSAKWANENAVASSKAEAEMLAKIANANKDYVQAEKWAQEIQMFDQGVHPTQIQAGAAAQNATTNVRSENRLVANQLLKEENDYLKRKMMREYLELNKRKADTTDARVLSEIRDKEVRLQGLLTQKFLETSKPEEALSFASIYNENLTDDSTQFLWYRTKGSDKRLMQSFEFNGEPVTARTVRDIMQSESMTFQEVLDMIAELEE